MKFSRLKASIENNAKEAPSIYMVICMIESLLDDIEDVTGQEIGDLPAGDDTLPTKLLWLCQMINQVYKTKSGELIRNRDRLDTAMKELERAGTELETLAETASRLSAVKTDLRKKQAALERARAEREEYEAIKAQCERLALEAESLRGLDRAAEEARLRALRAETAELSEAASDLEAERAAVLAARDEIVGRTADLRSEIEKTEALIEQKNNALTGVEKQRLEAQRRERDLAERLRETTEALSGLQDAVTLLETEKLPERRRQRSDEEARKNSLEQELASLESETGRLREENLALSSQIAEAREEFNTHNNAYSQLTEDYKQKSDEVAALVRRLEDLKDKTDVQKHEIYKRQMAEQIAELERMGEESVSLEQELAELDQEVKVKQRRVEDLNKKKAEADGVERQVSDALRRLEPVASGDFIAKLEENRRRLATLESVRGNLSATLSDMKEILGEAPVSGNVGTLDSMKDALDGLMNYTDRIQKNLVLYAKSVTLEERK